LVEIAIQVSHMLAVCISDLTGSMTIAGRLISRGRMRLPMYGEVADLLRRSTASSDLLTWHYLAVRRHTYLANHRWRRNPGLPGATGLPTVLTVTGDPCGEFVGQHKPNASQLCCPSDEGPNCMICLSQSIRHRALPGAVHLIHVLVHICLL